MKRKLLSFISVMVIVSFCINLNAFELKTESVNSQSTENPASSKHINLEKSFFKNTDEITFSYRALPGNKQDWITLVEADKPDNTFGQWFYTQGKRSGTHKFNPVKKDGIYEIRVYYNWPDGKYEVKDRIKVHVGKDIVTASSGYFNLQSSGHRANQKINIEFINLPGNKQDWITLVEANKPDNTFGQWFYTQGKRNGTHSFNGVPAGTYELRLYFNWPDGKYEVKGRETIIVKP